MKVIESMPRRELLAFAAELSEMNGFRHIMVLSCPRLLELLDDDELRQLIDGAVAHFRRELAEG